MKQLRIGVVDLVSRGPTRALWARVMNSNFAGIMPQAVAAWCRRAGHDVTYLCYTGFERLDRDLPRSLDVVFIGAFTEAAHVAYALANLYRMDGTVTVLGGPHARCYPQDACRYFDYVLGFTDEALIGELLRDRTRSAPHGVRLAAAAQPAALPSLRERWDFVAPNLRKAPWIKMVPMIGSVGCPYTCSFCIDAAVPYRAFDPRELRDDLRFLRTKVRRPLVGWHDPNFGVRFDELMDAIEEAVPPDSMDHIAESSLSLLTEPRLRRLHHNGFKALLPGIESWFDLGEKSRASSLQGEAKVRHVADHVNLILRHIPYVQTNFVLGMDADAGPEPFELTRRFLDLAPAAFPGFSLLTAFGEAAPVNLEYQRDQRVLAFPFHFLNNNGAMNVRPRNYTWPAFYSEVIGLTSYAFSSRAVFRRAQATTLHIPRWLNVVRALSSEGRGRVRYHSRVRGLLTSDAGVRAFFEGTTDVLPPFYLHQIRRDLGSFWHLLPAGGLTHDPNAWLGSVEEAAARVA